MFSTSDTIVAIATPSGRGGLGVIRISGQDAARIACELIARDTPLKPRHATFAKFGGGDQVVVTAFPSPTRIRVRASSKCRRTGARWC